MVEKKRNYKHAGKYGLVKYSQSKIDKGYLVRIHSIDEDGDWVVIPIKSKAGSNQPSNMHKCDDVFDEDIGYYLHPNNLEIIPNKEADLLLDRPGENNIDYVEEDFGNVWN